MNPINIEIQKKISISTISIPKNGMFQKIISAIKWQILFNSIFMTGVGIYFLLTLITSVKIEVPFSIFLGIYSILFAIVGFACVYLNSDKYNRYYAYLLLVQVIVFLILLSIGYFTISPSQDFKKEIIDYVKDYIKNDNSKDIDKIQLELTCCGHSGPDEYIDEMNRPKLPLSCCDAVDAKLHCSLELAHKVGCWSRYKEKVYSYRLISLILISVIVLFEIVLVVFYSYTNRKSDS